MEQEMKTFEALEWLRNNGNPSALATNRFGETSQALAFVERLYELGAVRVSVTDIWDEPERIEEEGGPYASSLIVELPPDMESRKEIIETYIEEMHMNELDDVPIEKFSLPDLNRLDFWWD